MWGGKVLVEARGRKGALHGHPHWPVRQLRAVEDGAGLVVVLAGDQRAAVGGVQGHVEEGPRLGLGPLLQRWRAVVVDTKPQLGDAVRELAVDVGRLGGGEIGRASCRERVCKYV